MSVKLRTEELVARPVADILPPVFKSTRHVMILQDVFCFTVVPPRCIGFPINPAAPSCRAPSKILALRESRGAGASSSPLLSSWITPVLAGEDRRRTAAARDLVTVFLL